MTEKTEEKTNDLAEVIQPEPIEKLKKYKYPYDPAKNKEYKQRSKQKKLIEKKVEDVVQSKLSEVLQKEAVALDKSKEAPGRKTVEKMEAPAPAKEHQEYVSKEKYKKLKNKINNLEYRIDNVQSTPVKVNPVYSYMFR